MGLGLIDRLELFVWALAQLGCYGLAALAAVALLTRPRETAGLLLGERGLRAAAQVLGPVCAAASRAGGGAIARPLSSVQGWAETLAARVLGSRDPLVTAGIWDALVETAPEPPGPSTARESDPGD